MHLVTVIHDTSISQRQRAPLSMLLVNRKSAFTPRLDHKTTIVSEGTKARSIRARTATLHVCQPHGPLRATKRVAEAKQEAQTRRCLGRPHANKNRRTPEQLTAAADFLEFKTVLCRLLLL